MISYAELSVPFLSYVDDQIGDTYRPSVRLAAFNSAIRRATTALGWAMANKKGPEEALRELTMLRIFQTNSQGGINLNDTALGHSVWNVLAVFAEPETVETPSIQPLPIQRSAYRPDLSFSGSGKPVERVTLEEVAMIRNNATRNGNEVLAANPKRVSYAYYIPGDASSTGYASGGSELRVIPKSQTGRKLIAVSYLKEPTPMTSESSAVEFPKSFLQTLVDWSVDYATIRQGDGPTMNQSAKDDAAQLFQMIA